MIDDVVSGRGVDRYGDEALEALEGLGLDRAEVEGVVSGMDMVSDNDRELIIQTACGIE